MIRPRLLVLGVVLLFAAGARFREYDDDDDDVSRGGGGQRQNASTKRAVSRPGEERRYSAKRKQQAAPPNNNIAEDLSSSSRERGAWRRTTPVPPGNRPVVRVVPENVRKGPAALTHTLANWSGLSNNDNNDAMGRRNVVASGSRAPRSNNNNNNNNNLAHPNPTRRRSAFDLKEAVASRVNALQKRRGSPRVAPAKKKETDPRACPEAEKFKPPKNEPEWVERWRAAYGKNATFLTYRRTAKDSVAYGPIVTVRGERHSGTNWLRALVSANCAGVAMHLSKCLDADGAWGWKHGFVPRAFDCRASRDVMLVALRGAASWAFKMRRRLSYNQTFDRLSRRARTMGQYLAMPIGETTSESPDGRTLFEGILQMRTAKYAQYASLAARCPDTVLAVRYEDVAAHHGGPFLFDKLRRLNLLSDVDTSADEPIERQPACRPDFVRIDAYVKFGHVATKAQSLAVRGRMQETFRWTRDDWDALLARVDPDLERRLGYVYDRDTPGETRVLSRVPESPWLVLPPATENGTATTVVDQDPFEASSSSPPPPPVTKTFTVENNTVGGAENTIGSTAALRRAERASAAAARRQDRRAAQLRRQRAERDASRDARDAAQLLRKQRDARLATQLQQQEHFTAQQQQQHQGIPRADARLAARLHKLRRGAPLSRGDIEDDGVGVNEGEGNPATPSSYFVRRKHAARQQRAPAGGSL